MGRKKRKVSIKSDGDGDAVDGAPATEKTVAVKVEDEAAQGEEEKKPAASNYAMQSHSGEIVEEDMYVSDGSEDEDDFADVVLSGSKVGLMRRGLHQPLVQPNLRQWVRADKKDTDNPDGTADPQQDSTGDVAAMDPAERAAQLLAEKQRKLEEAKESARRLESEENAGRDPCLFSKRTAFDIRFDQIDDKPWERVGSDLTDFFNYALTIDDWLEYAQQQLTIRQELTDASRQKRPVDPTVVPVTARKPKSQTPKVAVVSLGGVEKESEGQNDMDADNDGDGLVIGPEFVKKEETTAEEETQTQSEEQAYRDTKAGKGGVWGGSAEQDPVLARLIEEQEQKEQGGTVGADAPRSMGGDDHHHITRDDHYIPPPPAYGSMVDERVDTRGPPGIDHHMHPPRDQSHSDWRGPPRNQFHGQDINEGGGRGGYGGFGRGGRGRGGFGGRGFMGRGGRPPRSPHGRWGGRGGRGDFRRGGGYGGSGY
ncbi:mRNA processing [Seminavis robusta]|uniref:mRNA processing n=1 Tax=Seminavis robusta TaxID=568900 RepID=A0A9N8DIV8_9STRA|nr:mRNA processing [Seminavis robusta]|eukprot:Sro182_g079390.1 mRNA processing (482) ;mRNA; r:58650-60214